MDELTDGQRGRVRDEPLLDEIAVFGAQRLERHEREAAVRNNEEVSIAHQHGVASQQGVEQDAGLSVALRVVLRGYADEELAIRLDRAGEYLAIALELIRV